MAIIRSSSLLGLALVLCSVSSAIWVRAAPANGCTIVFENANATIFVYKGIKACKLNQSRWSNAKDLVEFVLAVLGTLGLALAIKAEIFSRTLSNTLRDILAAVIMLNARVDSDQGDEEGSAGSTFQNGHAASTNHNPQFSSLTISGPGNDTIADVDALEADLAFQDYILVSDEAATMQDAAAQEEFLHDQGSTTTNV